MSEAAVRASPSVGGGARLWIGGGLWLAWALIVLRFQFGNVWRILSGDGAAWAALREDADLLQILFLLCAGALALIVVLLPGFWGRIRRRDVALIGGLALLIALALGVYGLLNPGWLGLPALGEALGRGLGGVGGAALVTLAAYAGGAALTDGLRWRFHDMREALAYQMALGLGLIAFGSLALALIGLYTFAIVTLLIGAGAAVGAIRLALGLRRSGRDALRAALRADLNGADRLWAALTLVAVLIAFIAALAPEIEYDALWYHLWLPEQWLTLGHLTQPLEEYPSLYPMTWELIFGAGLALGGPVAAKLLHFICLPLTALLLHALTRRYLPGASPWLAVAVFVTVPTVLWEATTAYVDLALAYLILLTLYGLLRYFEANNLMWFILTGVSLGLALATKHLALFVAPMVAIALWVHLWRRGGDLRWATGLVALFTALAVIFPLPWYLRAWIESGNPFFPDLYSVFGAYPAERWDAVTERGLAGFKARFGRPLTLPNLLTLPWDMTINAASYGGSIGPAFLLLLPGLALYRLRNRVALGLLALVVVYVLLWASPISSYQMRFIIPITPILAVLAALAFAHVLKLARAVGGAGAGGALIVGLLLLLTLNLPPFIYLHENSRLDPTDGMGWLTHVIRQTPLRVVIGKEPEAEYMARFVPSYEAWVYINANLPESAYVLTAPGGDHLLAERRRLLMDATIARPAVWGSNADETAAVVAALDRLGITHVLFWKRELESADFRALAIHPDGPLAACYALEHETDSTILYRIRWEALTDADASACVPA